MCVLSVPAVRTMNDVESSCRGCVDIDVHSSKYRHQRHGAVGERPHDRRFLFCAYIHNGKYCLHNCYRVNRPPCMGSRSVSQQFCICLADQCTTEYTDWLAPQIQAVCPTGSAGADGGDYILD